MRAEPFAPFQFLATGFSEDPRFSYDPLAGVRDFARSLGTAARLSVAFAQSGRRIDLAGLDDKVGLLCAKALDLAPDEGRELRGDLILLRSELDGLAHVLGQPLPDP